MAMLKKIKRGSAFEKKKVAVKAHDQLRKTAYHATRDLEIELKRLRKQEGKS